MYPMTHKIVDCITITTTAGDKNVVLCMYIYAMNEEGGEKFVNKSVCARAAQQRCSCRSVD